MGDEGSIATRRVEAAWRGEAGVYTSWAGGEELSMTIEYSFPDICRNRRSLLNSRQVRLMRSWVVTAWMDEGSRKWLSLDLHARDACAHVFATALQRS